MENHTTMDKKSIDDRLKNKNDDDNDDDDNEKEFAVLRRLMAHTPTTHNSDTSQKPRETPTQFPKYYPSLSLSNTFTELHTSSPKQLEKSQKEMDSLRHKTMWFPRRWWDKLCLAWNPYSNRRPSLVQLRVAKIALQELPSYGYLNLQSMIAGGLTKDFITRDCWFNPSVLHQVYGITGTFLVETLKMTLKDFVDLQPTPDELVTLKIFGNDLLGMGMTIKEFEKFAFIPHVWSTILLLDQQSLESFLHEHNANSKLSVNPSFTNLLAHHPISQNEHITPIDVRQSFSSAIVSSSSNVRCVSLDWNL